MGIDWVEKGIAGQTIHSATAGCRIVSASAAIAANDIVPGVAGMGWIVDSKLRVIEDIETLSAEFEIALAKNLEVLQQGEIEIGSTGIIQGIATAVAERQTARSNKSRGIV